MTHVTPRGLMIKLVVAMLAIAPTGQSGAWDRCQTASSIVEEQKQIGVVTWITGDVAQKIANAVWSIAGEPSPTVDKVIVTVLYTGAVNLIPVRRDQVCTSSLIVSKERLAEVMVEAGASR